MVAVLVGMVGIVGIAVVVRVVIMATARTVRRVIMDRFDAGQRDVDGPIHRRPGRLEDARHRERHLVVVLETDVSDAMGDHDAVADGVTETVGDLRAQHGIADIGQAGSRRKLQALLPTVAVVLQVGGRRAQHAVPAVRIPERQRDRPSHLGTSGDVLVALPTDTAGGVADPEHRVEQQVERSASGSDDQIRARNRVCESGAGLRTDPVDADQQRHAHRYRQHRQASRQPAVEHALGRELQQHRTHRLRLGLG